MTTIGTFYFAHSPYSIEKRYLNWGSIRAGSCRQIPRVFCLLFLRNVKIINPKITIPIYEKYIYSPTPN
jgi:hypothetical protein